MLDTRPTIGTTQAGRMLGVSHDTAYNYWRRGLIDGYRMDGQDGGRLRLYVDSVEAFDRQRKAAARPGRNS